MCSSKKRNKCQVGEKQQRSTTGRKKKKKKKEVDGNQAKGKVEEKQRPEASSLGE